MPPCNRPWQVEGPKIQVATDVPCELKHLNASLATEVANWRIWACLLQQQTLQVVKDLNALLQQKLCYKLKNSNASHNRNEQENSRMLMGGNSFVGFCLSKDPKPWSLDLQWGKRETWVSVQVREREREPKWKGVCMGLRHG